MSTVVTLLADVLVAVLLVATIASSVALSRRITRLKADESAMRQTIGELMAATESAERAIAGLRGTLVECDRTLGERLRTAERYAADLAAGVEAGEGVLARIGQIVAGARSGPEPVRAAREPGRAPVSEVRAPAPPEPAPTPVSAPVSAPVPVPLAAHRSSPNGERLGVAAAAARALTERALARLEGRAA
jgi:hypothetical protein